MSTLPQQERPDMTATSTNLIDFNGVSGSVTALVEMARSSDEAAWTTLVERYLCLIRSVAHDYRLEAGHVEDSDDIAQTVWLRLFEHLDRIREPAALPGWIATTARHESQRVARRQGRELPVDPLLETRPEAGTDFSEVDEGLLRGERSRVLRDALAELPKPHRDLLVLLIAEPQPSYQDISRRLGIPMGSIGPTRARALERLRRTEAMRRYLDDAVPAPARRN
jgi:RNA polymerase sigma factor (sigma-70 family)